MSDVILTFSQKRALDAIYRDERHDSETHVLRRLVRRGFLDQDHSLTPKGREIASTLRPAEISTALMRHTIREHRRRFR